MWLVGYKQAPHRRYSGRTSDLVSPKAGSGGEVDQNPVSISVIKCIDVNHVGVWLLHVHAHPCNHTRQTVAASVTHIAF